MSISNYPKVSIIILNWKGWEDTIECLESVYQITYPDYDVIVVDNGSEDESIEKIKEYCEGKIKVESRFFEYSSENKPIKIIEYTREEAEAGGGKEREIDDLPSNGRMIIIKNEKNYGFAEGNNIAMRYGLKALNPGYVLLLNNDTVVNKDFLGKLVKVAEKCPDAGVLGPVIYYYDKPNQLWPTKKLQHKWILSQNNKFYTEVKWVMGCAFLIKSIIINKCGLLDPDYFLYEEEIDYNIRVKKAGYKLCLSFESVIWHKEFGGIHNHPYQVYYNSRNGILVRRKNYTGIEFLIVIFRYLLLTMPYYVLTLLKDKKFTLALSAIKGLKDGLSGLYGENKQIHIKPKNKLTP